MYLKDWNALLITVIYSTKLFLTKEMINTHIIINHISRPLEIKKHVKATSMRNVKDHGRKYSLKHVEMFNITLS
jgi:hypothetical protein